MFLFFVLYHAFWKLLWLRNSAWDFLGVKFWSSGFLGFCLKPWDFFWVFIFPPFDHPFHLKPGVPSPPLGGRWGNPLRWGNPPVFIISHYFSFDNVYMIGGVTIWEIIWTGGLPHLSVLPPPPPCKWALTCSVGNHIPKAISSHWTAVLASFGAAYGIA